MSAIEYDLDEKVALENELASTRTNRRTILGKQIGPRIELVSEDTKRLSWIYTEETKITKIRLGDAAKVFPELNVRVRKPRAPTLPTAPRQQERRSTQSAGEAETQYTKTQESFDDWTANCAIKSGPGQVPYHGQRIIVGRGEKLAKLELTMEKFDPGEQIMKLWSIG